MWESGRARPADNRHLLSRSSRLNPEHRMTVVSAERLTHERIHPGLPPHLPNHSLGLLAVDFDRRKCLGVPASPQANHTGCPEDPDPSCFAKDRH
jgi:hypothetical protein